jgi:DNA-directed RNA polymerase sigma subunit (sigma70/sigma32)
MQESCTLDLAANGPMTLDEAGKRLNVTRERMRQMETRALIQLRRRAEGL